MNKNDQYVKILPGKSSKNTKTFLTLLWLGIFKINSTIISSQMIGKVFPKNADF
jgi:hypothetical protein